MSKVKIKLRLNDNRVKLDRLLVCDADVFVYQAIEDNKVVTKNARDEYSHTVDAKTVQRALKVRIDEMRKRFRAKEALLCFGGMSNWRKKLLPEYKAHRVKEKPMGYWDTIEWCSKNWPSKQVPLLEADDVVGIYATDPTKYLGWEKIIVSEDKDLLTVPGKHYNPRTPEVGLFDVTQEEAAHNHLMQALCGDTSDGYKGCPGAGPVKATEILASNKLDPWAAVVAAFEKAGQTEEQAIIQARVARILQHGDYSEDTKVINYWFPPTAKTIALPGRGVKRRPAAGPTGVRRVARA